MHVLGLRRYRVCLVKVKLLKLRISYFKLINSLVVEQDFGVMEPEGSIPLIPDKAYH